MFFCYYIYIRNRKGVNNMAQINFRVDDDIKRSAERTLNQKP